MRNPQLDAVRGLAALAIAVYTRRVRDWPEGRTGSIHLKVVDEGTYELLGADGAVLKSKEWYVPRCLPQEYGDYLIAEIGTDGAVDGWRPSASDVVDDFWPEG